MFCELCRSGRACTCSSLNSHTFTLCESTPRRAQVKKAQTLTEKILARHSNNASVAPGQNIWTNVDKLMTHDVCGPGTFGIFQREFGENAQVQAVTLHCVLCGFLAEGCGLLGRSTSVCAPRQRF